MRLLFAKALFRMARDARRDLYLVMMEYVPYEQRQEIGLPNTHTHTHNAVLCVGLSADFI